MTVSPIRGILTRDTCVLTCALNFSCVFGATSSVRVTQKLMSPLLWSVMSMIVALAS